MGPSLECSQASLGLADVRRRVPKLEQAPALHMVLCDLPVFVRLLAGCSEWWNETMARNVRVFPAPALRWRGASRNWHVVGGASGAARALGVSGCPSISGEMEGEEVGGEMTTLYVFLAIGIGGLMLGTAMLGRAIRTVFDEQVLYR